MRTGRGLGEGGVPCRGVRWWGVWVEGNFGEKVK